VNKAWQLGILKHPLSEDFGGNYPIVQYANDTPHPVGQCKDFVQPKRAIEILFGFYWTSCQFS
jgi:hypothetical protein